MKLRSSIPALLGLIVVSTAANAAEEKEITQKQLPPSVHSAFLKAYPHAKPTKYLEELKQGTKTYEIEFDVNGKEFEAFYRADGTLLETEEAIKVADLPSSIVNALKGKYPKSTIKEAEKTLKPDGTLSGYDIEIAEGKKILDVKLDTAGNILSTEAEQD